MNSRHGLRARAQQTVGLARLFFKLAFCIALTDTIFSVANATSVQHALRCERLLNTGALRSSATLPKEAFVGGPTRMDEDPYVQTLIGNLKLDFTNLGKTPGNERVFIDHPSFEKRLPLTANLRRNEKGQVIKAPLVVVLVGMHGNAHNDAFDRFITRRLSSTGNHVVLFPNPFGDSYAKSSPHYPSSSILAEARVYYDTIRLLKDQGILPAEYISETRIVGYSYGGLIASVLASQSLAYDRESGLAGRTIDGDVTIISPPLYLRSAQRSLDDLIATYEQSTTMQNAHAFLGLVGAKKMTRDHAKVLMGRKFRENLIQAMFNFKASAQALRLPNAPDAQPGHLVGRFEYLPHNKRDPKFREFSKSNLSYNQAQQQFTDSTEFWKEKTGLLSHWIRANQEVNGPPITMVAAKDDILNLEDLHELENFPLSRADGNLVLIDHGGHGGFVYSQWFTDLMNARF